MYILEGPEFSTMASVWHLPLLMSFYGSMRYSNIFGKDPDFDYIRSRFGDCRVILCTPLELEEVSAVSANTACTKRGGFVNIFTTVWRFRAMPFNLYSKFFLSLTFEQSLLKKKFCFNMNQKLITKSWNWKKFFFQNIIAKRYLAICLNKICTNFITKMAKLFKLKEMMKFFYSFCPNFDGGAISGNLAEARKCRPYFCQKYFKSALPLPCPKLWQHLH